MHVLVHQRRAHVCIGSSGDRYNHFLIDEFQDTSVLQWQNMLPLITDSLDFGKNLIVGDGKQSIYRWRGGEVEQFVKIPEVFKGEKLPPLLKQEWESKMKHHHDIDNLKSNFRSKKEIIEFNNNYTQVSADTTSSYFDIYMGGLEPERYYTILLKTTIGGTTKVFDEDIMFKVTNG